jgi:hypothetical protein
MEKCDGGDAFGGVRQAGAEHGSTEAERRACEIRLRAERKAGQLSRDLPTSPGARTDVRPSPTVGERFDQGGTVLKAAGISPRPSPSRVLAATRRRSGGPVRGGVFWQGRGGGRVSAGSLYRRPLVDEANDIQVLLPWDFSVRVT